MRVFDLRTGESKHLSDGCSASYSPDGSLVSKLVSGHRKLALLNATSGKAVRTLSASKGIKYDNHFWTNHPDWIAGELEGNNTDVLIINTKNGAIRRITKVGNASRADVYIQSP